MAKERTDAERRARQCERLSRVLRVLRLIMGSGRWDAVALARELECSRRTIDRDPQTLSMAGVPWYYDEQAQAIRVRPGFRFPGLEAAGTRQKKEHKADEQELLSAAKQLLSDGERLLNSVRRLCSLLGDTSTQTPRTDE